MHRRFFLKVLTAGAVFSAAGGSVTTLCTAPGEAVDAFPLSCMSDRASAERIGRCFLRSMQPARANDAAHYLQLLFDDLGTYPAEGEGNAPADRLHSLIRRDYAEDRLVCVDGWYLSATEVRLCVAAALS